MSGVGKFKISQIGVVRRQHQDEEVNDRNLVSKIVIRRKYAEGLKGIEDWSHFYVIFWMHEISDEKKILTCPKCGADEPSVGIFATRAPVRPNPIGLTLVELVKRDCNVLWVKGLDALDGSPVLDLKPYPYWVKGEWIVVTDYRKPEYFGRTDE